MFFCTASASGLTPNVKLLNFTGAIIRCYRWENSYKSKERSARIGPTVPFQIILLAHKVSPKRVRTKSWTQKSSRKELP